MDVALERLRNQRLPTLDDGGPAGGDGDLAVGSEEVRVFLGTAGVMDEAIPVHEFADQHPVGNGLHRIGCDEARWRRRQAQQGKRHPQEMNSHGGSS